MSRSSYKIIVLAKAPIAGQAKTRMIPQLGEAGAAQLQQRLLQHTISLCHQAQLADIALYCSPNTQQPIFQQLQQEYGISLHQQQGNDIGQRMHHAIEEQLRQKSKVVLVGTDCPSLNAGHLKAAFDSLSQQSPLAIAPAKDGGYVLIAATRIHPAIFQNIHWSSERVYAQTQQAIKQLGWQHTQLQILRDLDTPDDLKYLNKQQRQILLAHTDTEALI